MLIGLTGQIGSGKSTAAKILASFGAIVLDADQIGRQVVENSPELLKKLVYAFGVDILKRDGRLDRKRLAALAFENQHSRLFLNSLVHPYLLRQLRAHIGVLSRQERPVVIDAALLLDWKLDRDVDAVIVISAPHEIRLRRLTFRGMTLHDARSRERAQLSLKTYREKADYFLSNTGDKRELRRKLREVWLMLLSETR